MTVTVGTIAASRDRAALAAVGAVDLRLHGIPDCVAHIACWAITCRHCGHVVAPHVGVDDVRGSLTVARERHPCRPSLRLITCGGDFDRATRQDVSNTVVFASLVSSHRQS